MRHRTLQVTLAAFTVWLIVEGCSDSNSPKNADSAAPSECGACQRVIDGQCEPASDGSTCADGQCHEGNCCSGCWDGKKCVTGESLESCGEQGNICEDCRKASNACFSQRCQSPCEFNAVATSGTSTCAVHSSGRLYCWGDNGNGQLGTGDSNSSANPRQIGQSERWKQLAVGAAHSCGLVSTADIWCWGNNADGQLGVDDTTSRSVPTHVASTLAFAQVSAGANDTCAVDSQHKLYCWGKSFGTAKPRQLGDASNWNLIDVGASELCGIRGAGELYCWAGTAEPKRVGTESNYSQVAVGAKHRCVIAKDGALYCFGSNEFGQLGIGTNTDAAAPTRVTEATYQGIAVGDSHSCAITKDGKLQCWGANDDGQLGLSSGPSATNTLRPTAVAITETIAGVTAGGNVTCARTSAGKLYCFGRNDKSALGLGNTTNYAKPQSVCVNGSSASNGTNSASDSTACPTKVDCTLAACETRGCGAEGQVCQSGACVCPAEATAKGQCGYIAPKTCPETVDCAIAECTDHACGANGKKCSKGACVCPSGATKEANCSNLKDDDCDGKADCEDDDCATAQCGSAGYQRCCSGSCVDTSTDIANCQGCGLHCASGQSCKRTSDADGVRGHCTCTGDAHCPHNPGQICRAGNNDGQDGLCACDVANAGNSGCASGQSCSNVAKANFCHY